MRLPFLLALIGPLVVTPGSLAQVPAGEYVRNYSPGFSGESLVISGDSNFVRHEWRDVSYPPDSPGSLYLGDAGNVRQSGATLVLDYERAMIDSVALDARADWFEPVDAWVAKRLDSSREYHPSLTIGEINGTTVLVWPSDVGMIYECEQFLSAEQPDDLDAGEALDWQYLRERTCGALFLPPSLVRQVLRDA